jgi:hypothetical protein
MTARALGGATSVPKSPARKPVRAADAPPPVLAPIAAAPKPTGMQRMQAKGRLPKGEMNATETKYAGHLDELRLAGEVLWWKFEAITLTLAPKTTLTVDFSVMLADGSFEMHDVKGAKAIYTDDAKVKMKVAAQMFPFVFRVVFPVAKGEGGGWNIEEVRA